MEKGKEVLSAVIPVHCGRNKREEEKVRLGDWEFSIEYKVKRGKEEGNPNWEVSRFMGWKRRRKEWKEEGIRSVGRIVSGNNGKWGERVSRKRGWRRVKGGGVRRHFQFYTTVIGGKLLSVTYRVIPEGAERRCPMREAQLGQQSGEGSWRPEGMRGGAGQEIYEG